MSIAAGSGVSVQGGSGGDLELSAGSGYGEEQYGGNTGVGGSIGLTAGGAIEGSGGDITHAGSTSQVGGSERSGSGRRPTVALFRCPLPTVRRR